MLTSKDEIFKLFFSSFSYTKIILQALIYLYLEGAEPLKFDTMYKDF